MKRLLRVVWVLVVVHTFSFAQTSAVVEIPQQTQARGYWIDPATNLMWAAKDNGHNIKWRKAIQYCRDLRIAGYSHWSLATLPEEEGIYDPKAESPGMAGEGKTLRKFNWHVKGNLFLTGNQWTSPQIPDDRGRPSGYAWRFDFNEGRPFGGDEIYFTTNKRALCVRGTANTH